MKRLDDASSIPRVQMLVRLGYVPLLLVCGNGLIIALASRGASGVYLLCVVALAIGISFAAERLAPYARDWNASQGDARRDFAHFVVNEIVNVVSLAALPWLPEVVRPLAAHWPAAWPFLLQVAMAIVVFDLGVTLTHWASHRVAWLWRFHAVHHSVRRFYGFNGLMKHPVHQVLEVSVGIAPLLALGIPSTVAAALAGCTVIQLLLQHSNVDYRIGRLRTVLALNEGHRFHHLKWAGVGDVNFGLFTSLGDRLLGTWYFDPQRRFGSSDLGIAQDPGFPTTYLAQLVAPFRDRGTGPIAEAERGSIR